jgi:thiamine biosynthesis lipoprotein ApbE
LNGDAFAAGRDANGEKWKLPIEGARDKNAAVYISNQGAATSGVIKRQWKHNGKNVHHLVNPKNPDKFSFGIRAVVVVHKKTEWADGRAKVLVLMGLKKGLAHAKKKKLKAMFVDREGIIFPNQRD